MSRDSSTENTAKGIVFLADIWAINSLFAMASFKSNVPGDRNVGQGHWCFYVCGQIYHYTEAIPATPERQRPILNQYYFVDADDAINRRSVFILDRLGQQHQDII